MERFPSVFGGMTRSGPRSSQQLQDAIQTNHQNALIPSPYHNSMFNPRNTFCFGVGRNEQVNPPVPLFNANKNENSNLGYSRWLNDQNQRTEDGAERRQEGYQRMRWTNDMVKILITAVSYIEEDALVYALTTEDGNLLAPPIKGKWRAISKAMTEKGHVVSPQQCEDKFNDLNKRYKRLNEILGKDTACEIVKNPSLVDVLSISEEAKDEATKLLGCKQLFFREMCSFHNKNRKYLPHDEALKKRVQFALRGKVKYQSQDVEAKRQKQGEGTGVSGSFTVANGVGESTSLTLDAVEGARNKDQWMKSHSMQLEEKASVIKNQMLELEKSKLEWMKWCEEEDMELNKARHDNELMKFENKRLAYEIECQSKGYGSKS